MLIDDSLTAPQTLKFGLIARERKQRGEELISLGLGEPEFDTPAHIKQAAKEALDAGFTRYGEGAGLLELRQRIARKLNDENRICANARELIVTPGAKNALFLACAALLRPGDEAINLTPCYVSNYPILRLAEPQARVVNIHVPVETGRLPIDEIRRHVNDRTRLILINTPNNPTGNMMHVDDAHLLRELVRERRLFVIADEIYERIIFGAQNHVSLGSFQDIREQVITVNGFSKAYSMTGWRIGYVHAYGEVHSLMSKIHAQLNTNTAEFIQKAAIAALDGPQEHLTAFLANLGKRRDIYRKHLLDNEYLSGSDPQGGLFGFVNIASTDLRSDDFASRLLEETGVVVIPGISFGEEYDDYCRVSLVNETSIVEEGMRRFAAFAGKMAKKR